MSNKPNKRNANRESSDSRGYDAEWRKVRAIKVEKNPLCERCLKIGKYVPINKKVNGNYGVVHHIIPVEERPDLRLVLDNLESLCFECHEAHHGRLNLVGCDASGFPLDPNHFWNKS